MAPHRLAPEWLRRLFLPLAGFALAALVLAPSLIGRSAFLPANVWQRAWPWRAVAPPAALTFPDNPLLRDAAVLYAPQLRVVYESLREGHFPLWNPHFGGGEPLLPTGVSGPLAATNLPILLLPWPLGFAWSAWLRFGLMWAGAYLYGRALRLGPAGSTVLAVGMSLTPGFLAHFVQPHATAHLHLPWLLWALERMVRAAERGTPALVASACPLAFLQFALILSGHPDSAFHVTLGAALYLLVRFPWRPWRSLLETRLAGASAMALGCAMAAPLLVPFADWLLGSATFADRAGAAPWALDPEVYRLFWDPFALGTDLPGAPARWSGAGNFEEGQQYIGMLPWVFLFLGLTFARRQRSADETRLAALAVMAISCGSLAYGWPPLWGWLSRLPPFAFSANPRLRFIVHSSVLIAALLVARGWPGPSPRHRMGALARALLGLALLGSVGLLWMAGPSPSPVRPWLALATAISLWTSGRLAPSARDKRAAAALAPVVLLADLAAVYAGQFSQVPRNWADPHYAETLLPREILGEPLPRIASDSTLPPNLPALIGAASPIAYSYPVSRRYLAFTSGVLGLADPAYQIYPAEMHRPAVRIGLARTGATWLVTAADLGTHVDGLELVTRMGGAALYRNHAAVAWAAWHPREEVSTVASLEEAVVAVRLALDDAVEPIFVEASGRREAAQSPPSPGLAASARYATPQRIDVEVPVAARDRDGILVVRVSHDPGWFARDGEGRALALHPAQVRFMAIETPKGVERVQLRYVPPRAGVSLVVAGTALATAAAASGWARFASRRRR